MFRRCGCIYVVKTRCETFRHAERHPGNIGNTRHMMTDFQKYASLSQGISPMALGRYSEAVNYYINPSIIEERKLNVASMDVFSRLMMDRIIFLGVPIDDDVANIIQAQLLYLA